MATRKRTSAVPVTTTTPQRHVPEKCPVCDQVPELLSPPADHPDGKPFKPTAEATLLAHLEQHRPVKPCRHEHLESQPHKGWILQWDAVQYYRTDVGIWVCNPCGFHSPVA
jgi:hypothetical protein